MTDLHEFGETGKDTLMSRIFSNQKEVFADWFSGEIRVPRGEMLQYVHMSYASVFEEDLFLSFQAGVLTDKRVVDNTGKGLSEQPRKPGAMSPAAWTCFRNSGRKKGGV
ncbi:MAG: hypothetical protein LBB84_06035 [Tannerellaceae bacterium]|nr:hypothetical protein [Tannerellaceae bacterium]